MTTLQANRARDPQKQSKPFDIQDFQFFRVDDDTPRPPAAAGTALVELERMGRLPAFALSFFKELSAVADPAHMPHQLAWIGDDVLLLAPYRIDEQHWGGFLIAEAEAAGQVRLLHSETDQQLALVIPASVATAGAVMAAEGLTLPIA